MARKRGREEKFPPTGQGGEKGNDQLQDALLKLDPGKGETDREAMAAVSKEAHETADRLEDEVASLALTIEEKKLSGLEKQKEALDSLTQEMRLVGIHSAGEIVSTLTEEYQERVDAYKAKAKDIASKFKALKAELQQTLGEGESKIETAGRKEGKKASETTELSADQLNTIIDYYLREIIPDKPEMAEDATYGVLLHMQKGDDLYSKDRQQKAVRDAIVNLANQYMVAMTMKDKKNYKAKWLPRFEKLKDIQNLLVTMRGAEVVPKESTEPEQPIIPEAKDEETAVEKIENKKIKLPESGDILVEKGGKINHQILRVIDNKVGDKSFRQFIVLTRANGKMEKQVFSEDDLAGLKIIRMPVEEETRKEEEVKKIPELTIGQMVNVRRSAGEIDGGWEIVELKDDKAVVRKETDAEKKHFIVKRNVSVEELQDLNPAGGLVETEEAEEKPEKKKRVSEEQAEKKEKGEEMKKTEKPEEEPQQEKAGGEKKEKGKKKEEVESVAEETPEKKAKDYENEKAQYLQNVDGILAAYEEKLELVRGKYPRFYSEFSDDLRKLRLQYRKEVEVMDQKIREADVVVIENKGKKKKGIGPKNVSEFIQESLGIFEYAKYTMDTAYDWLIASPEATPWGKSGVRIDAAEKAPGLPTDTLPAILGETEMPAPQEAGKKSWWQRTKEKIGAVVNRNVGKVAAGVAYRTAASVFGVKTATDILGVIAGKFNEEFGFGDIHKRMVSSREMKAEKFEIKTALDSLAEGGEKIGEKIEHLKQTIENAEHVDKKDKEALLKNLQRIATEYDSAAAAAGHERDREVESLLKVYMKNKVAGMTLAKDLLNTALTATGMSMVRGAVYAAMSVGERLLKSEHEFEKIKAGRAAGEVRVGPETKGGFVLKDLMVNAAVETGRSLIFMGAKKETSGTGRVIDFLRAAGTVARGFGIYGLAMSDSMSPGEALQAFIGKIQEQGITCAVKEDFISNAEKVIQLYAHPIDTIGARFGAHDTGLAVEQTPAGAAEAQSSQIVLNYHLESSGMKPDELNQVVEKFGQFEKAGISTMALQHLGEAGATPASIAAIDNMIALSNGRPEAMSQLSEAISAGHSPEEVFQSTMVHKGDGLERVLQRQLKLNPAAFGFKGDLSNQAAVAKWAGHEASVIAQKNGLADKYFVFHEDKPQFLLLNKDGNVGVTGRLYTEIPKPPAEIVSAEHVVPGEHENGVNPVQELVDAKTGQPVFMTRAERAEYDRLVRNEEYDNAMAYMLEAKQHGPVFELEDGRQIHRSDVTEWVGGRPDITVAGDVRINFEQDGNGPLRAVILGGPNTGTLDLLNKYEISLSHSGLVRHDFIPDLSDGPGSDIVKYNMRGFLTNIDELRSALDQTSVNSNEYAALMEKMRHSVSEASAWARVHPDQMFEEKFLNEIHYGEEPAVTETAVATTGVKGAEPKTYEEIVQRAKQEVAAESVEESSEEMFDDLEKTSAGFHRFFDKGTNFHERLTVLHQTLEPNVRTVYNNVEYTYDGRNIHYRMGSIVGVLDTPQEANALADMDYLYRMKSMEMQNSDSQAAKDFTRAMDALRGGTEG